VVVKTYSEQLGVRGHPVLLFVDRAGNERLRRYGPQTKEHIRISFEVLANAP